MVNHKNQFLVLITLISSPLIAKDFVDDVFNASKTALDKAHTSTKEIMQKADSGLQKAQKGLEKAGQELMKAGESAKQAIVSAFESKLSLGIQENDQDNTVVITVQGIKADKIEATLNDENDTLTINADSTEVIIYAKDRIVTASIRQKTVVNNKNAQAVSYSSMQESRTINGSAILEKQTINLDKQTINYDQAKQELTIVLPKASAKKAGKPVAVNVINKQTEVPAVEPKSTEQTAEPVAEKTTPTEPTTNTAAEPVK